MADDTKGVTRLNYFNSQLLDETDFKAEQKYHVDMRRRLNRLVHTWGVAGETSLKVTKEADKKLKLSAGMAIDKDGQEIVFNADLIINLESVTTKANTTLFLTLAYKDVFELAVQDIAGADSNFRRMGERPTIDFPVTKPPDDGAVITLAAIKLDANANIAEIDNTVRTLVGSVIDPKSELSVRKINVSTDVNVGANLNVVTNANVLGNVATRSLAVATSASIAGDADVSGKLSVTGGVTLKGDTEVSGKLTVSSAKLSVIGAAEDLRIVRGTVGKDTRIDSGGGFAVKKVEKKSGGFQAGLYDISFVQKFSTRPSATVTIIAPQFDFETNNESPNFENLGGDPRENAVIVAITAEKMRVKTCDGNGNQAERNFSFIVVGSR